MNFKNQQYVSLMCYTTNIWIFLTCFLGFFLIFNYLNFDIGMFVLRKSTSEEGGKRAFIWHSREAPYLVFIE